LKNVVLYQIKMQNVRYPISPTYFSM
jgi:hypothetical protein